MPRGSDCGEVTLDLEGDDSVGDTTSQARFSSLDSCVAFLEEEFSWEDFKCFCEDLRGGGLGGMGESLLFFCSWVFSFLASFSLLSPFTVEPDDDEVNDSRRLGSPSIGEVAV